MLAEQQTLEGMPAPVSAPIPRPSTIPAHPPALIDETHAPVSSTVPMHLKGNPAQYDLDIIRVVQSSVNAMTVLISSRPAGNITPLFTEGHRHYTRLALMPCLLDMARPYFTDDEMTLLAWAQRTVHYEATLRSNRMTLPTLNRKGVARMRSLGKRLQASLDTLAINAGMRRTASTSRSIAEAFGADAEFSGPVALV